MAEALEKSPLAQVQARSRLDFRYSLAIPSSFAPDPQSQAVSIGLFGPQCWISSDLQLPHPSFPISFPVADSVFFAFGFLEWEKCIMSMRVVCMGMILLRTGTSRHADSSVRPPMKGQQT